MVNAVIIACGIYICRNDDLEHDMVVASCHLRTSPVWPPFPSSTPLTLHKGNIANMDVAYDHIQEEALEPVSTTKPALSGSTGNASDASNINGGLNAEFQEAFKAVSSSPWGARLGGFLGQLKSQVNHSLLHNRPHAGTNSVHF